MFFGCSPRTRDVERKIADSRKVLKQKWTFDDQFYKGCSANTVLCAIHILTAFMNIRLVRMGTTLSVKVNGMYVPTALMVLSND